MNTSNFRRKTFYVLAIVALLVPLYVLGQPSSQSVGSSSTNRGTQGGTLSQLRERYDFGQTSLGELDPASETMRLATLGLRGVAATILWQRADFFKEEKYWDKLSATLNQLALLQPHFVSVWDKQAHNLSYNVSAEFDDYRQRYLWVKKGIEHLVRGTEFNRQQPMMPFTLGKYTTQKFGRSDEQKQFRELFRNDEPFHRRLMEYGLDLEQPETRGADGKPDNWLVGRLWYQKAYQLVDSGARLRKSPLYFYMESPLALMYYSDAIESEGVLDDRAMFAWSRASDAWAAFGEREIQTTWNHMIRLRAYQTSQEIANEARKVFDEFTSDLQIKLIEDAKGILTADQYRVLKKAPADRTREEKILASTALMRVLPPPPLIAQKMPREKRAEAVELATVLLEKEDYARHILRYREQCNYDYWEALSELEQTPTTVAARRQIYEADRFLVAGDLENAIQNFEVGWKNWDRVLRKYPLILHDEACDRLLRAIKRYADSAHEGTLPDDFPLQWFYRYRGIRDTNKQGEETLKMYDEFVENSKVFDAQLDIPYEVGSAPPEKAASPSTLPQPPVTPQVKPTEANRFPPPLESPF